MWQFSPLSHKLCSSGFQFCNSNDKLFFFWLWKSVPKARISFFYVCITFIVNCNILSQDIKKKAINSLDPTQVMKLFNSSFVFFGFLLKLTTSSFLIELATLSLQRLLLVQGRKYSGGPLEKKIYLKISNSSSCLIVLKYLKHILCCSFS